ncbi:MAG: ABC transporter ATP-binding protein [Actinomycetota bacterium]|nr:ABC transporter ATP-binding protein [Actinomycetota bacterium]
MWMQSGGVAEEDRLDPKAAARVMRRAARMLRPQAGRIAVAVTMIAAYTGTVLAGPLLVRYGIDVGITDDDPTALNLAVAGYVVAATLGYFLSRRQIVLINRVGEEFLRDLRIRTFAHLQRLSLSFYDREKAGVVVSRMTSDIDTMQELVQQGLLMLTQNVLLLVLSFVVLALVSWQLLLVCVVAVPVVVIASWVFQKRSNVAYLAVRDRIGAVLSRLQEGIAGVRVIQAYGREDTEARRFAVENRSLYRAHLASVRVQSWYIPLIDFAGVATTAGVLAAGGWMVTRDVVTVGTVAFFVLTLSNLFEPVQQLSQLFNIVQSAGAALRKVFGVLDAEPDVTERRGAVALPATGTLEVRDVGFAYNPGEDVLRDVSMRLAPGERLALVGPTGAGKSTLAKLIARLYDPTAGTVSYGGVDLRDATLGSLRERIVVIPQEGFLFGGTIAWNIRLARPDATDADVRAALDRLGVLERFTSMEHGLDTDVGERGSRLSAGEKQLVSLARAALVDPAVLVLDEATSSLDPGTETIVEAAITELTEGRSVVVIAHRLSTAERADRVAVVVDGVLAEYGSHDELVVAEGPYSRLYATWTVGLGSN